MRNANKYFAIILLLSLCSALAAQEYSYVNYTTKDGLAGSTVYDAVQDKDGFMWFATENGLSRFDGKTFKNLTVADGLPDNEILKLFVDSKNRVWIMPFKNEVCYYFKGKIYTKKDDTVLSKIKILNHGVRMFEDKNSNLLLCVARGYFYLIRKNGSVSFINYEARKKTSFISAIPGIDEHGEIKFCVPDLDNHNKKKHHFFWPVLNKVSNLVIDSNLAYMVELNLRYRNEFLYAIRKSNEKPYQYYLKSVNDKSFFLKLPENVLSLNYLGDDRISVNTTKGAYFYDIPKKETSINLFTNFLINNVIIDREGNYWFSSRKNGVLKVPSLDFRNIKEVADIEISSFLYGQKNILYAGGENSSLFKMEKGENKFLKIKPPSQFSDASKFIEIININGSLLLVSDKSVFCDKFPFLSEIECPKSVWKSPDGILISACYGVQKYYANGAKRSIWQGRSTCSVEKDSGYYIGTLEGLYFVSKNKQKTELSKQYPVLASRIVNLEISHDSILWITTKGRGVYGYKNGKVIYGFNELNGLSNNDCSCIYADSATSSVWVGTAKGLNRIKYGDGDFSITKYSASDGLMSDNITAVISVGKKVFVGTAEGVSFFEPEKISQQSASNLAITGIFVNGKYFAYDSTGFSLPHTGNNIRIEFSGISFKSGGEMKYEHRLLGLHNDWRSTQDNSLNYTELASGKYTLELKAINKYGIISSTKEISFEIRKLLQEKWWFRLLVLAAAGSITWFLLHYRTRSIRRSNAEKAKIKEQIAALEQTALRAQMNPHFIFNCLNSIQQYVAERDIQGANRFIADFSKVIRMTLDMSARPQVSLNEELEYLNAYLRVEKTRMEKEFDYFITVDEGINTHELYLPPLLLQPYVENSIRHGIRYIKEKGRISIWVRKNNSDVTISIEDNGIGREVAAKYKSKYHVEYQSKGMAISSGRIELVNKAGKQQIGMVITDLTDELGIPSGTRVDILLSGENKMG